MTNARYAGTFAQRAGSGFGLAQTLRPASPPRWWLDGVASKAVGRGCIPTFTTKVASAAGRLDQFLAASGINPTTRITILTDGAGEFDKAAKGCAQPMCRILEWFHISRKFKAAERSAFGCQQIGALERDGVEGDIRSAKWLVWHGKASQAVARLQSLDSKLLDRPGYEFSTLWWNIRNVTGFVRNNVGLVNYARRRYRGLPVSSAIAESAVNQVVSLRMGQEEADALVGRGSTSARTSTRERHQRRAETSRVPIPFRSPKPTHDPEWDAYQLLRAA